MIYYLLDFDPIGWIATFFGWIMEGIYFVLDKVGIANLGLCIIVFTVITKLLLLPLTIKQAKSTKLQSVTQPEIQAIQAKYKGKEGDQQAMMMQQAEIKAVYQKYGTSMTSGCLPLLIQFPIIFGLYRVIRNTPMYISTVKGWCINIIDAIGGEAAIAKINEFITSNDLSKVLTNAGVSGSEVASTDNMIAFFGHLTEEIWVKFAETFPDSAAIVAENYAKLVDFNSFLGMDLAMKPSELGLSNWKAWIIPILAGVTQYLSSKVMSAGQPKPKGDDNASKTTNTMLNSMNIVMPIMSVVFCFTFNAGIGVYWIAQAVVSGIIQIFINKKMKKIDVNDLIKKNLEKTNKKRAKKGLPPINEKAAEDNYRKMQDQLSKLENKRNVAVEKTKALQDQANSYYKTGSIADRARMVQQYNEKNEKKK